MKSAAEREKNFRDDLNDLLKKHGAKIQIEEVGECYETEPLICVVMETVWDSWGDRVGESVDFYMGTFIDVLLEENYEGECVI